MNRFYRSVWNAATQSWAAASELTRSRGKGRGTVAASAAAALLALGGSPAAAQQVVFAGNNVNSNDSTFANVPPGTVAGYASPIGLRVGSSGIGSMTVTGGATVRTQMGYLGNDAGSAGTAAITGAGSNWTTTDAARWFIVGKYGTGSLTLGNGAFISAAGYLRVGEFGTGNGTLNVTGGSRVTALANSQIGVTAGAVGVVTVNGANSQWNNTGLFEVGRNGTGTLTIRDGGRVSSNGAMSLGLLAGSRGTLNIGAADGAPAAAAGTLNVASLVFGAGSGILNFNHTTAGYEFATPMSGAGTVNVIAGTTILTGVNSYSGTTDIRSGATLRLGNGAVNSSAGTSAMVDNGALVFHTASNLTAGNAISGTGTLTKGGAGELTLTGPIDIGAVTANGGTLTFAAAPTIRAAAFGIDAVTAANASIRLLNGGTVSASGDFGFGLNSSGAAGRFAGDNLAIRTTGLQGAGVFTAADGRLALANSTITTGTAGAPTTGTGAHGAYVYGGQTFMDLQQVRIQTHGNGSDGVNQLNASTLTFNGLAIDTRGDDAHGIRAQNQDSFANPPNYRVVATGDNLAITTSGARSVGLSVAYSAAKNPAYTDGHVHYTLGANGGSSTIRTTGADATGVFTSGSQVSAEASNLAIVTGGTNAHGIEASGGSTLSLRGVTAQAGGVGAVGLRISGTRRPRWPAGPRRSPSTVARSRRAPAMPSMWMAPSPTSR